MSTKKVTIKDIASVLGVTPMTVSKALNGHPDISRGRKQQILETARQMNYVPNVVAKNLRTRSSSLIGVIVADNSNPYFANVIKGIEQVASHSNRHIVIFNSNEDPAREKMFINDLRSLNVAGIIISPALGNKENVDMIRSMSIPCVLCSRYIDRESDIYVTADDVMAGYFATRHLLASKGPNVYFINSDMNISTARDRLGGYTRAFAEKGLAVDTGKIYAGAFSMKDGYRLAKTILETAVPPFSLLCYSDYVAVGALQALSEAGLCIPGEVALMGIDNIEYSAFTNPQLSTVEIPSIGIGTDSAKLLLEIIESAKRHEAPARGQIVFPPHIKIRRST